MMRFFRFALHALILILHIEIQVRIDQTLLPLRREVTKNGKLESVAKIVVTTKGISS